ncbi:MAG: DUF1080 domain-containing protein [Gemmatimonadota bacterium]|nr:DUF1080 domain-containing protein [Gemmatimonadota bacterium]
MAGASAVEAPLKRWTLWALALGAVGCATGPLAENPSPGASETRSEWIPLFNGRDLSGWTPKIRGLASGQDPLGTFRVEDGMLVVSYESYEAFDDRFGHLFYEQPFGSYRLRVEYRFVGDQVVGGPDWAHRNSGIMFHSQSPATMGIDQDFPISLEAQFLGGNGRDPRPTANLCTPGTHVEMGGDLVTRHCIAAQGPTFHGDRWVTVEIEVHEDRLVRHLVNGATVLEYGAPVVGGSEVSGFLPQAKRDGTPLGSGFLALQSESHPIQFRRVELLLLEGN